MFLAALLALAIPPTPTSYVTDTVAALSSSEHAKLESQLQRYHDKTGHQVIVYIAKTTGGDALEDFTSQAGHQWKIGNKGKDDGAILFVFTGDRAVRIEVGYGLEGELTDAQSSTIVRDDIVPKLQAGNVDAAVQNGVDAMVSTIGSAPSTTGKTDDTPWYMIALFVVVALIAAVLALAIPSAIIAGIVSIFKGPAAFWPTFWTVFRILEWIVVIFGGRRRDSSSGSNMRAGGGDFGGGGSSGRF